MKPIAILTNFQICSGAMVGMTLKLDFKKLSLKSEFINSVENSQWE